MARGTALTLVHGFLRQRPCPVIVFPAPRDSGKTALLDDLAERMQGVPHALIYCQDFHGGTRELLALLAFSLNRRSCVRPQAPCHCSRERPRPVISRG